VTPYFPGYILEPDPAVIRKWRAFVEDLAAIGGHVAYATHDDIHVVVPPDRAAEGSAIIERRLCDYIGNVMKNSIVMDVGR
jgi:hypothetical protein